MNKFAWSLVGVFAAASLTVGTLSVLQSDYMTYLVHKNIQLTSELSQREGELYRERVDSGKTFNAWTAVMVSCVQGLPLQVGDKTYLCANEERMIQMCQRTP